jgi:hypothetical protein
MGFGDPYPTFLQKHGKELRPFFDAFVTTLDQLFSVFLKP